jgi:hypothetical protein
MAVLAIASNLMAYHVDWTDLGGNYALVSPSNIDVAYEMTGASDGVWRYSDWSAFPSLIGYNFWEVSDYEDCPRAKMTTSSVLDSSKTYAVYVLAAVTQDWDGLYAGISTGEGYLADTELTNVTLSNSTEFSKSADAGAESLYKCLIGEVSGVSSLSVEIDDYDNVYPKDGIMRISYTDGTGENSRFVGLAWVEVPEPATMMLLVAGVSALVLKKRK